MPLGKLTREVGSKELKDFYKAWVEARLEGSGRALWKQDSNWPQLFKEGMQTRYMPQGSIGSTNEPVGMYTTPFLNQLDALRSGLGGADSFAKLVDKYSVGRAATREPLQKGSDLLRFVLDKSANNLKAETPEKWIDILKWMEQGGLRKTGKDVYHPTKEAIMGTGQMYPLLKSETIAPFLRSKGYDAVTFPDIVAGGPDLVQTAILRPGITTAQIGPNVRKLAIAGMMGGSAMGLMDQLQPNEAQASPVGNLVKDASKLALGGESSTASALIGKQLKAFGDRVVQSVRKAPGDKRYLVFEDGTAQQVTKQELNSVMRTIGTEKQVSKFNSSSDEQKKLMAIKRMVMEAGGTLPSGAVSKGTEMSTVGVSKGYTKGLREADNATSRSILNTAPDTVGVWKDGKYITMNRPYAELLEKEGLVKIDRSKGGVIK